MKIEATTAEMLAVCHTQIAIADNMSSMGLSSKAVSTIQKVQKRTSTSTCGNCTKHHTLGHENCPAKNAICHKCKNTGHWSVKCRKSKKPVSGAKQPQHSQKHPRYRPGGRKKTDEIDVSEENPNFDEVTIQA